MKLDPMPSYLQQQLQTRMEAKQLSVYALEKKSGLNRNAVWYILRGLSKKPRAEALKAIADVLECTVDALLGPRENDAVALATLPSKSYKLDQKLDAAIKENHKWNEKLYQDAMKLVSKTIADRKLDLKFDQIMAFISETYKYSVAKSSDKADKDFVNWLFNKNFKQ
jgi:transcriptional regulator with XRE-family HTH domain